MCHPSKVTSYPIERSLKGLNNAFASGQDGFLASLATNGIMDSTYHEALVRIHIQSSPASLIVC